MNDYGHVDDDTPSFAISPYEEYCGQGIGSDQSACFCRADEGCH